MVENRRGFVQPLIAFIDEDRADYEETRESVGEETSNH